MATPPVTPPRGISSGYLSMRLRKAVGVWSKPLFFVVSDSQIPLNRLELVYKGNFKNGEKTNTTPTNEATNPAEKSVEAKNKRLLRTLAIAAVSGSGIVAAYKSNSEADLQRPVVLINVRDIVDVTLTPKGSKEGRHAFTIHTLGKNFVLAAKTEIERENWVKALQRTLRNVSNDDIEANPDYRVVYEMLVAKKAFTKDIQVEDVKSPIKIVVDKAPAVNDVTAASVEQLEIPVQDASAIEAASAGEVADAVEVAPTEPTDDLAPEIHAPEDPATEEPAAQEPSTEELATEIPAGDAADIIAEAPKPTEQVPAVAAKPKSLFAFITARFKKRPVARPIPEDIDDYAVDVPAANDQADPVVKEEVVVRPEVDGATPVEIEGEEVGEANTAAAAPARPKAGLFRFSFASPRETASAKGADTVAVEESSAVPGQSADECATSEPAKEIVQGEQVENNPADAQLAPETPKVESNPSDAQPVEGQSSNAQPAEDKPKEITKPVSGFARTLNRLFKRKARTTAVPANTIAEDVVAVAADASVDEEAVEVAGVDPTVKQEADAAECELPAESSAEATSETAPVETAEISAEAAADVVDETAAEPVTEVTVTDAAVQPDSEVEPSTELKVPSTKPRGNSLMKSLSKIFKKNTAATVEPNPVTPTEVTSAADTEDTNTTPVAKADVPAAEDTDTTPVAKADVPATENTDTTPVATADVQAEAVKKF